MATPSDAGFMSDAPSAPATTPKPRQYQRGSSARPRAPPSESLAAPSDDEGDGYADDQIPGHIRRRNDPSAIPRVEDRIGITVQEHFENFIEEYVLGPRELSTTGAVNNIVSDISKTQLPQANSPARAEPPIGSTLRRFTTCVYTNSPPSTSTTTMLPLTKTAVSPMLSTRNITDSSLFLHTPCTT